LSPPAAPVAVNPSGIAKQGVMIDMDYADDDEGSTQEREPEPEPVTTKKKFRRASVSAESDVAGRPKSDFSFSLCAIMC
jgi:hypothetical protein